MFDQAGRNRLVLVDKDRPTKFMHVMKSASKLPVSWYLDLHDSIFENCVLGISRDFGIREIVPERKIRLPKRYQIRNTAFRHLSRIIMENVLQIPYVKVESKSLKQNDFPTLTDRELKEVENMTKSFQDPIPSHNRRQTLTLILRDGSTRQILNENKLVRALQRLPITVNVFRFGDMSFSEQVSIMRRTDVLLCIHGEFFAS